MNTKRFTILHSNDMHGDFLAEMRSGESKMIGGLALLSGYLNKVRQEEENVLFAIAGDMVQGSIIDAEYRGVSTIEIMNYLAPDVATLGNHEFDYGLPHLLWLEKLANFPIVNANLYIKDHHKRLMHPYVILNKAGLDIMFIGIITDKVIDSLRNDESIGSFITLQEAAQEVGRITNAYKNDDIDLTVLLTHIGYDSDCELAAMLDPAWGVDVIIGGHSHTILRKPALINGVLVAQAGVGTDQIGRFDVLVDDDTNRIVEWNWRLIPIDSDLVAADTGLQRYVDSFKDVVDRKYNTILCKFAEKLAHPRREVETPLGNLVADALAAGAGSDVMLMGSGAIRSAELGPIVTLGNFVGCFPFQDTITRFHVTGADLKQMFNHWMRPENRTGEGECYQVNAGVRAVYDEGVRGLQSLSVAGQPVADGKTYTVAMPGYHARSSQKFFAINPDELVRLGPSKVVCTRMQDALEEYFRNNQNVRRGVEGRLVYQ
ncbi:MAG: bifunctional metallophosphatase/5'-nucleotidase [Chloroflexi bacterium]|nr:bifunctional metallophosphatase/5'-nucleotidase [Chloroflexota bacterium]MCL5110310.1 bifunctional metallophosphatase/5'-nucleotidase [Chloroflexota bacterium]